MRRSKASAFWDGVKVLCACALVLTAAAGYVALKLGAYGGHPECLLVKCVELIP